MNRLIQLTVALGTAFAAFGASAQALEFKGVPFGASADTFREANKLVYKIECTVTTAINSDTACMITGSTYANVDASLIAALFFDDRLGAIEVTFPSKIGFETIRGAVASKYGNPARQARSILGNRMGAVFEQLVLTWAIRGGGTIELRRFTDIFDDGILVMRSSAYGAELQRRSAALPPAKKDI